MRGGGRFVEQALAVSDDVSLKAADIARILACSERYAYELMTAMPHEGIGARCIRVKRSMPIRLFPKRA